MFPEKKMVSGMSSHTRTRGRTEEERQHQIIQGRRWHAVRAGALVLTVIPSLDKTNRRIQERRWSLVRAVTLVPGLVPNINTSTRSIQGKIRAGTLILTPVLAKFTCNTPSRIEDDVWYERSYYMESQP